MIHRRSQLLPPVLVPAWRSLLALLAVPECVMRGDPNPVSGAVPSEQPYEITSAVRDLPLLCE